MVSKGKVVAMYSQLFLSLMLLKMPEVENSQAMASIFHNPLRTSTGTSIPE